MATVLSWNKDGRPVRMMVALAGILLSVLPVRCQIIDSVMARSVAEAFYREKAENGRGEPATMVTGADFTLVREESDPLRTLRKGAEATDVTTSICLSDYYIFNVRNNRGFVIVSGRRDRIPVPAFALEGSFDPYNMPPACGWWLSEYSRCSGKVRQMESRAEKPHSEQWDHYLGFSGEKGAKTYEVRGPLLETTWGQGCFYNDRCPEDDRSPCGRVPAGCVAVAMGQVMRYWEHPFSRSPVPGYDELLNLDERGDLITGSDYGWIPGTPATTYAWSAMPSMLTSSCSIAGRDEISRLLFHCGTACRTNFGPFNSESTCSDAAFALSHYFGFDHSLTVISRSEFTLENWAANLRSEIDCGMPVIYSGSGPEGAHAFNCDGYDSEGRFHMNWGWDGHCNGFFYLFELDPDLQRFTSSQKAIVGIRPDAESLDPCLFAANIEGAGPEFRQIFYSESAGSMDGAICGWSTPGAEKIYRFRPLQSDRYTIRVVSVEGYVDCGWNADQCNGSNWICAGEISAPGDYGSLEWEGGKTYYLLFDGVDVPTGPLEFYIIPEIHTSTEDATPGSDVRIYPNPVTDWLYLEIPVEWDRPFTVVVAAPDGRSILCREFQDTSPGDPVSLNLSAVPAGIYGLRVTNREFRYFSRVVVQ